MLIKTSLIFTPAEDDTFLGVTTMILDKNTDLSLEEIFCIQQDLLLQLDLKGEVKRGLVKLSPVNEFGQKLVSTRC